MKSMKGLSMNKMLGKIQRRTTSEVPAQPAQSSAPPQLGDGAPEEVVARAIRHFCESGGPTNSSGDEVILLPTIVEAAESSPAAAAEAAHILRKFLSKDYYTKPSRQYNALMIIRILADNPGPSFTRNVDKKFVETTKELLRSGRDPSVLNLLWETLDSFEAEKAYDEGLRPLLDMWKKEKERSGASRALPRPQPSNRATSGQSHDQSRSQNYWAKHHSNRRLPHPAELASRLEEARTSAKLLQQAVACTPPQEVLANELIREFADRCQSASRSIQMYMVADDPAPDNDTMESLIDTNEQLQVSLNQHQRAVLGARKAMGIGESNQSISPVSANDSRPPNKRANSNGKPLPPVSSGVGTGLGIDFDPPGGASSSRSTPAPPGSRDTGKGKDVFAPPPGPPPNRAGPSGTNTPAPPEDDPFRDPTEERYAFEPYHPGFSSERDNSKGGGNGKQPAVHSMDNDDDDDLYATDRPKKDPSSTILRY